MPHFYHSNRTYMYSKMNVSASFQLWKYKYDICSGIFKGMEAEPLPIFYFFLKISRVFEVQLRKPHQVRRQYRSLVSLMAQYVFPLFWTDTLFSLWWTPRKTFWSRCTRKLIHIGKSIGRVSISWSCDQEKSRCVILSQTKNIEKVLFKFFSEFVDLFVYFVCCI